MQNWYCKNAKEDETLKTTQVIFHFCLNAVYFVITSHVNACFSFFAIWNWLHLVCWTDRQTLYFSFLILSNFKRLNDDTLSCNNIMECAYHWIQCNSVNVKNDERCLIQMKTWILIILAQISNSVCEPFRMG